MTGNSRSRIKDSFKLGTQRGVLHDAACPGAQFYKLGFAQGLVLVAVGLPESPEDLLIDDCLCCFIIGKVDFFQGGVPFEDLALLVIFVVQVLFHEGVNVVWGQQAILVAIIVYKHDFKL